MLSVKELKNLAQKLPTKELLAQLGPFVLVQKAVKIGGTLVPDTDLPAGAQRTSVVSPATVSAGALSLLFQFDELVVATIPPLHGVDELTVGRQPDNELVLDHPSVSKHHAILRWDGAKNLCSVQDKESMNGTWVNASIRIARETPLHDGDILSFGEVQYWFLLTDTLHDKLTRSVRRDIGV